MTFDEFIEWVTQSHGLSQAFARRHSSYREIVPTLQRDWVANHAGEIIVDFVGRYERLQADWEVVCKKAALPTLPLPEVNRSREVGEGYRSYYTPETRKAVASYFEADIETFGYRF